MKEDLILVTGVLVAAVMCVWYMAHAVLAGVVHPIPTDDACSTATQCLAIALGQ
jgi:hypothetical protein